MSFMAGFGSGFSDAFARGYTIEKQRQNDAFEKMYDNFEKNKTYLDEYKTQDAKDVASAKAILEQVPGMPKEALGEVYTKVKSLGYDAALKWAANVKLEKTGTLPVQTDAAMGGDQKGPAVENPYAPTAPKSAGGGVMDKIKGGLDQLKFKGDQNVYEGQIKRMQEATGLGRKEVEKILLMNKGGIPLDPEVEQASQNQFSITPNPNATSALDQTEVAKLANEVPNKMGKEVMDYRNKKNTLVSAVGDIGDMANVAEQTQGQVFAGAVGGVASFVQEVETNLKAGYGLITGNKDPEMDENIAAASGMAAGLRKQVDEQIKANPNAEVNVDGLIAQQEMLIKRAEESMVGQNINKLANARALMAMKSQLLAYKLATLYGQDGKAIAEGERKMFQAIAAGGNTTEKFVQNMSLLIGGEISKLQNQRKDLFNHPAVIGYETATKSKFPEQAMNQLIGGDVREDMMVDPRAKVAMEMMDQFNTLEVGPVGQPAPATGGAEVTPPPQGGTKLPHAQAVERLRQELLNGNEAAKEQFQAKFGYLPQFATQPQGNQ